ncbi:MAG: PEP-CTERM sorting domain-containing protein [Planctomycetota bacterium]|jgi:hypothetical protein
MTTTKFITPEKIRPKPFITALAFCFIFAALTCPLHAEYKYDLQVFTNNGGYASGDDLNLYVIASSENPGLVDFTFHNQSLVNSAIAELYFENNPLLSTATITNGAGTLFNQTAAPKNLPAACTLDPVFTTTDQFAFDSEPAPPKNGINPGQSLKISFSLTQGTSFAAVLDALDSAALRIGAHIIALPDCSSESAVTVPEPATVFLLAFGSLALLRRKPKP